MQSMADFFPSRRDLFRLSGGALALGSLSRSSDALAHQFHLRGQVKDAETGLGLPGIRVSNGRDIVTTDDAGAYILPPNGEASIFVVKPAGWSAPRDPKTMLSRIHHQPDPTRSLDFVLERTTEDSTFDVLMFADPQPSNSVELDYLRAQLGAGFSASRAAFGLTLGDLVGDDHTLFERYNEVIAQIGAPWWNLPGNHDLDFSAPNGSAARATWRRVFGPTTYAFEYARATFIMLDNVDINRRDCDLVNLRRRVGTVFQKSNPFPKSIFENVVFGPRVAGLNDRAKLQQICERSLTRAALWNEVKDRLNESALALSGGQAQRLCIARALATDPEVLLLDEPASALDPASTSRIEDLIFELKENYTIVIVTHNMQQAARVSDQTAFFFEGKLIESGPTKEMYTRPKIKQTEDYITGRFG
jgi:phosphate transport system ATP-binding protein